MEQTAHFNYNRLWKLLIDRRLRKKDLQRLTLLSSNVITKMGRGESVTLETLAKICLALQCGIADIVEIEWRAVHPSLHADRMTEKGL